MAARGALVAGGLLLLAIGVLRPVTVVADGREDSLSVLDSALGRTLDVQLHDTYIELGGTGSTWAARFLIVAALAAAAWILIRPSRRGLLGVAALWAGFVCLFLAFAPRWGEGPPPSEPEWTSYPPLSAVEGESWASAYLVDMLPFYLLGGGALLLTLAALRRASPAPGLLEAPAAPEDDRAGDQ